MLKSCLHCGGLYNTPTCPCKTRHKQEVMSRPWRAASQAHRQANPWCADCLAQGIYTLATQVHHVDKRSTGGLLLSSNLMSLCASHHSQRTGRGE